MKERDQESRRRLEEEVNTTPTEAPPSLRSAVSDDEYNGGDESESSSGSTSDSEGEISPSRLIDVDVDVSIDRRVDIPSNHPTANEGAPSDEGASSESEEAAPLTNESRYDLITNLANDSAARVRRSRLNSELCPPNPTNLHVSRLDACHRRRSGSNIRSIADYFVTKPRINFLLVGNRKLIKEFDEQVPTVQELLDSLLANFITLAANAEPTEPSPPHQLHASEITHV